jgi:acyl-CoA thioesterase
MSYCLTCNQCGPGLHRYDTPTPATCDDVAVIPDSVRRMLADDLASRSLGISLVEAGPGFASVRMTVVDSMVNGHGIAHGGYLFLLADTAFACACNSHGPVTVAAGADITFVTSATLGDELVARAEERVTYGRSGICDVTVRRGDDVVAEFRGRSRTLR